MLNALTKSLITLENPWNATDEVMAWDSSQKWRGVSGGLRLLYLIPIFESLHKTEDPQPMAFRPVEA